MVATVAVRQDNPLFGRIDGENEIRIDHQAPAQTDEVITLIPELVADQGHHRLPVILRHHRRVVPLRLRIDEAVGGDPEEFRALGYDDDFTHC